MNSKITIKVDSDFFTKRLSPLAIVIYILLYSFRDEDYKTKISYRKLSFLTGRSRESIKNALYELEQKGFIGIRHSYRIDKSQEANIYVLYDEESF